jgi:hypothetical protein
MIRLAIVVEAENVEALANCGRLIGAKLQLDLPHYGMRYTGEDPTEGYDFTIWDSRPWPEEPTVPVEVIQV